MKARIAFLLFFGTFFSLYAQNPASAPERVQSMNARVQMRAQSPYRSYPARNIGPVVQGGRISALEVDPRNHNRIFAAYASGGLFLSENNGQSFEPIFDEQGVLGIGDVALSAADPNVIWVGTGENNSSRSSYAGAGVWRSTDGGKSWVHCGLEATEHIGRIVTHPTDVNTAWVAAIGGLYHRNADRGVFKTTDGGKTWRKVLYINDNTGVIDLVQHPKQPDKLYAAAWERSRRAWEFVEGGEGSGLYISEDGGENWSRVEKGLPNGPDMGRMGIAVSASHPETVYVVLDNQEIDPSLVKEDTIAGLTMRAVSNMSSEELLALDVAKLDSFVKSSGYPKGYDGERVQLEIREGKYTPKALAEYFGDANEALFNSAVKGAELYRSDNGGKTWKRTHAKALDQVFYTYGYYFGQVRVNPVNPNEVYIFGVPLLRSADGGSTWSRLDTFRVHVDHHALWINPENPAHLRLGNDGGLYQSYDKGAHWDHLANLPVGQFYTVSVDMETPYNVYGGLQDNGVLKGSSRSVPNRSPEWEFLFGGDGMYVFNDPEEPHLVYTGYQFGHYYRLDGKEDKTTYITPKHDIGEAAYRSNWRTPLRPSPHNAEILYLGNQYVMRSLNKGDSWARISPDLTTAKMPQGNVPYSTISVIEESPLTFGLIWVGTDDGKLWVTLNGGADWKDCSAFFPKGLWVSYICPSPHDEATAFVTLNGYRDDNFKTYTYRTDDYGASWRNIAPSGMEEVANVLIQDPKTAELLFLGTDHGTYLSLDGGGKWEVLSAIPNVAAYDMVVHPRDPELVVATHGRSIFVTDISLLRRLSEDKEAPLLVVDPDKVRWSSHWGEQPSFYREIIEPAVNIEFFSRKAGKIEMRVNDEEGKTLYSEKMDVEAGYGKFRYDLKVGTGVRAKHLEAGEYPVEVEMDGKVLTTTLKIVKRQ